MAVDFSSLIQGEKTNSKAASTAKVTGVTGVMMPTTTTKVEKTASSIAMDGNMCCTKCGVLKGRSHFYSSKSWFFQPAGRAPICKDCINQHLGDCTDMVKGNKVCQYLDIAFDPNNWLKLLDAKGAVMFEFYHDMYQSTTEDNVDWTIVNALWSKRAEELNLLNNIDFNKEQRYGDLRKVWGDIYTDEELDRLQRFYEEIDQTQNINTAIQKDNARKISKLSLQLDKMIESGEKSVDIKNISATIDALSKAADFTTKSAKNIGDFDSVGELFAWLEKRGWLNPHYDWQPKDEVDKVMDNIQKYCKRIILGETDLATSLEQRISAIEINDSDDDVDDIDNFSMNIVDDGLKAEFDNDLIIDEGL